MIFEGKKACFSPQVPRYFRVSWVENGGTLTHSAQDFFNSDFFFCTGTKDTWLDQLRYRGLIVRHPSWIIRCVEEEFLMPCSKYILDECFDETMIHQYHDISDEADNYTTRVSNHYNTSQDTTMTLCEQESTDVLPEGLVTSAESPSEHPRPSLPQDCKLSEGVSKRRLGATQRRMRTAHTKRKTCKNDKSFQRFIEPIDTKSQIISLFLEPPLEYPGGLLNQSFTSSPPRLSLASLLSLPEVESTLFKPTELYKGDLMWVDA